MSSAVPDKCSSDALRNTSVRSYQSLVRTNGTAFLCSGVTRRQRAIVVRSRFICARRRCIIFGCLSHQSSLVWLLFEGDHEEHMKGQVQEAYPALSNFCACVVSRRLLGGSLLTNVVNSNVGQRAHTIPFRRSSVKPLLPNHTTGFLVSTRFGAGFLPGRTSA